MPFQYESADSAPWLLPIAAREDNRWPGKDQPNGQPRFLRKTKKADIRRSASRKSAAKGTDRQEAENTASARGIFAGLQPNAANFAPLTPLSFLKRAADIHPDRTAVIHGERRISYRQFYERAKRLASALRQAGVKPGDTVSVMLPNVPAMLEAHYGVPMLGAVLNTINTRLEATTIAYILQHGEAKVLITDREFAGQVGPALAQLKKKPARHRRDRRAVYRSGRAARQNRL